MTAPARPCIVGKQDERGSSLLITLVILGAFALLAAIVLNSQASGYVVQTTLSKKADVDATAKGLLNEAVRMIQLNQAYGQYGAGRTCGSKTAPSTLFTTPGPDNKTFTIACRAATTNTGLTKDGEAIALPQAITTIGGVNAKGALRGAGADISNATKAGPDVNGNYSITYTLASWPSGFATGQYVTVYGVLSGGTTDNPYNQTVAQISAINSGNRQFTISGISTAPGSYGSGGTADLFSSREPFCQNYSTGNDHACEAGIWVTNGNTDTNGVVIKKTLPTGGLTTLIKSNSSIVVNLTNGVQSSYTTAKDGNYFFKVEGNLAARYSCDHDVSPTAPTTGQPTPGVFQLQPAWNRVTQWYDNSAPSPTNTHLTCAASPNDAPAFPIMQTPIFPHRLMADPDQPLQSATVKNPGAPTGLPLRSVPSCPNVNGSLNYVEFLPGRYNDAAAMNSLFGTCKGLFYFNPDSTGTEDPADAALGGVFFFDFTAPLTSAPRAGSQVIIGGNTFDWTPPSLPAGRFSCEMASTAQACPNWAGTQQRDKILRASNAGTSGGWPNTYSKLLPDPNDPNCADPSNPLCVTAPQTMYADDALQRDGYGAETTAPVGSQQTPTLTLTSWKTPPPDPNQVIGKAWLLVTHRETGNFSDFAPHYPQVILQNGAPNWNGNCTIELPKNAGSDWRTDVIDITRGCDKARVNETYDVDTNTITDKSAWLTASSTCNSATDTTCIWTSSTQNGYWRTDPGSASAPTCLAATPPPTGQIGPGCAALSTGPGRNETQRDPAELEGNSYWLGKAFDASGNNFNAKLAVQAVSGKSVSESLDAMELHIDYDGLPAPNFPGSCRTDAGGGVQMLFGNRAAINWAGQASYLDVCGSWAQNDPYGMAVYGLHPGVTPPPATIKSGGTTSNPSSFTASNGNVSKFGTDSTNTTATAVSSNMGGLPDAETAGGWTDTTRVARNQLLASQTAANSSGQTLPCGVNGMQLAKYDAAGNATLSNIAPVDNTLAGSAQCRADVANALALPDAYNGGTGTAATNSTSLVANWNTATDAFAELQVPPNFVPDDAQIVRVEIKIRHREGAVPAAGGCTASTATNISALTLSVGTWSSGDPEEFGPPYANQAAGTDHDLLQGYQQNLAPTNDCGNWKTFDFGRYIIDDPAAPACLNPSCTILNPAWKFERTLTYGTDGTRYSGGLYRPSAINGAKIRLTASSTNSLAKRFEVDSMQLIVQYRPADSLKPLSGCLTMRYYQDPETAGAEGVDGWWHAPTTDDPVDRRVPDWTASKTTAGSPGSATTTFFGDGAFAPDASGTNLNDTETCPLIRFDEPMKVHLKGAVYAPTAAVDLRGVNNGAPMVSNGIIVRQLTIYKWTGAGRFALIGGDPPSYRTRDVIITATLGSEQIEQRRIRVNDDEGKHPGQSVTTYWTKQRAGA